MAACRGQTCYALASSVSRKDKASDGPVNLALFRMGSERIRAHYSQTNPAMLPAGRARHTTPTHRHGWLAGPG